MGGAVGGGGGVCEREAGEVGSFYDIVASLNIPYANQTPCR